MYELITLEIPYDNLGGKAGRSEYLQEMKNRLVPPSRRNPDFQRIPRALAEGIDRVVCRSLALDPDERHPTPGAWLDELDGIRALIQNPRLLAPADSWLSKAFSWLADRFQPTNPKVNNRGYPRSPFSLARSCGGTQPNRSPHSLW